MRRLPRTGSEENTVSVDSLFNVDRRTFIIVKFYGAINCEHKVLIEYKNDLSIFINLLHIYQVCDFDISGHHTIQRVYKFHDNKLYVYNNYYKIERELLVIDKKESDFIIYELPSLKVIKSKNSN